MFKDVPGGMSDVFTGQVAARSQVRVIGRGYGHCMERVTESMPMVRNFSCIYLLLMLYSS